MIRALSAIGCVLLCAAVVFAPLSARADDAEARAVSAGLLSPANAVLQRALQSQTVAQTVPGQLQRPVENPGLPTGLVWTLDANSAWSFGKTGAPHGNRLPGGMDAVVMYGFNPSLRVVAGYYELSEYPVGFDTGTVPLYLQGFGLIGSTDLSNPPTDATVKNKIFTASAQNLLTIGLGGGTKLPIVISPSYLARWGSIGGHDDTQLIETKGFPSLVRLRTYQAYLVAVTLPFLSTPRMFATATVAPHWLVHPAGVNETNHMQLFEVLYAEYRATKNDTVFFQPSRLIDYLPPDPFPEYVPTMIYGIAHKFNRWSFVQVSVQSGGATNRSPYGITSYTCQRLPCSTPQIAAGIGGLHAAQFQVQYGIGSPSVIPL